MDTPALHRSLLVALFLLGTNLLEANEPLAIPGLHGGLVVQLHASDFDSAVRLCHNGRHLVHLLNSSPAATAAARAALKAAGLYGLGSAGTLTRPDHLPYTENLANAVVVHAPKEVPLAEVLRILAPRGTLLVMPGAGLQRSQLEAAGFQFVSSGTDGTLVARKPWPESMDVWSHPRHGADGNPVSRDTATGAPERIRWVAAATSEVEGLVTNGGRNFYGGVLARDSFNGLRLWHRNLGKGELNEPDFALPALSYDRARPVASGDFLFAVVQGKLTALDAATGEVARQFPGIGEPNEVVHTREVIVATDDNQIRAFDIRTANPLWSFEAGEPRHLALDGETVCFMHGRIKRGETAQATALDFRTGRVRWERSGLPWLEKVTRIVMHGGLVAFEVSSLTDHDAGNTLHLFSAGTGEALWEKTFAPGMNHMRQVRAMFTPSGLWIVHGGKENTRTKETTTRTPVQVSSLDPKTGEVFKTHPAGLAHCFPPVATVKHLFSGVLDLTDMDTGQYVVNPITKANCSREGGWVPANGLVYTTPKHCTCWPMLRGYVALAPAAPHRETVAKKPLDQLEFPLIKGPASPAADAPEPAPTDWPTYRSDRWRSGSSTGAGPADLTTKWSVDLSSSAALPEGPIVSDWRENPFVKGPVSAPAIANGRVFVTLPDAHEVVALDAATGAEKWRFTAQGRVDTPPTIHRGLALFGCHAGFVYALRAGSGELVWRFQAAPLDERIVAYGQIESPWPVPGAVLVRNETACFVAGRQPLADGGVFVFGVDPLTGRKQWVHRIDRLPHEPDLTGKDPYKGFYENSGVEFDPVDILHEEGDGIAMSRWILSGDGSSVTVDKWNAFARLDTGGGAVWVPRGSWAYGARHQARFRGEAARRPLVVFRDGQVFGQLEGSTDLFRRDFDAASLAAFDSKWITGWAVAQQAKDGGKPFRTYRVAEGAKWTTDPFTPAEAKAKPFVSGAQLFNDVHALALAGNDRLYAIHKDGRLKVIDTSTGAVAAERHVPSPLWDGLALAGGDLFLTTLSGEVWCLGSGRAPLP